MDSNVYSLHGKDLLPSSPIPIDAYQTEQSVLSKARIFFVKNQFQNVVLNLPVLRDLPDQIQGCRCVANACDL